MSTKVDICNQALNLIGENSITSFEENSTNARRCKTLYDQSRKSLLRLHPFTCATKRIVLSPLANAPQFEYAYQFQLPDDLIRIVRGYTEDYTIESDKILADTNQFKMTYVFDNKNEETFDSLFEECLVLYIGSKLSKAVTGSQTTGDSLYMQCQELMAQAKATQAQEKPNITFGSDDDFTLTRR